LQRSHVAATAHRHPEITTIYQCYDRIILNVCSNNGFQQRKRKWWISGTRYQSPSKPSHQGTLL